MSQNHYQVASAIHQKSPTSRTRTQSGKNTSRSRAKSGKQINRKSGKKTRAQRRIFQQRIDHTTTLHQSHREKSTKAERDITHPAVGTLRKSIKYITYNSLVPYPSAPQPVSEKHEYGLYICNYEQYARTVQMIDAINAARINGQVQPPKEFELSEFIQRRIANNKRKHQKRAQKRAQQTVKPEEGTEQPNVEQATIKEPSITTKTKEVKIVEKLDENLEALNTAIEKMENLKTQPIQVVKIKDKRTAICALKDTATDYQSVMTAIKAPPEQRLKIGDRRLMTREQLLEERRAAKEAAETIKRDRLSAIFKNNSTNRDLKEQKPVVSPQITPDLIQVQPTGKPPTVKKTSGSGTIISKMFGGWKTKKS